MSPTWGMGVRSKNQLVSQRSQETGERQPLLPEAKGGTGYSRTTQEVKRRCTKGKIVSVWDFCLAQGPSGITHITLHSRAKGNGESLVKYCSKGRPELPSLQLHKLPSPQGDWNVVPIQVHQPESWPWRPGMVSGLQPCHGH